MYRIKCDMNLATVKQITGRVFNCRNYVTRSKNLYDVLGLTRMSTQVEIKAAYYKLSMIHHPDKNKDNELAAEKFREITEAYEVLGNFRLRKLYDKGIIHTAGEKYAHKQPAAEEEENDPTTRFYKARMKKEHATATGRTPIYDFDEWTQSHYGKSFQQQQKLKRDTKETIFKKQDHANSSQKDLVLVMVLVLVIFMIILQEENRDVNRLKKKKNEPES